MPSSISCTIDYIFTGSTQHFWFFYRRKKIVLLYITIPPISGCRRKNPTLLHIVKIILAAQFKRMSMLKKDISWYTTRRGIFLRSWMGSCYCCSETIYKSYISFYTGFALCICSSVYIPHFISYIFCLYIRKIRAFASYFRITSIILRNLHHILLQLVHIYYIILYLVAY